MLPDGLFVVLRMLASTYGVLLDVQTCLVGTVHCCLYVWLYAEK